MNDGQERDLIKGLILNSPFRFQSGPIFRCLVCLVAKLITGIFPYAKVNRLYRQLMHKAFIKIFYGNGTIT
jgi:hypothetical protein